MSTSQLANNSKTWFDNDKRSKNKLVSIWGRWTPLEYLEDVLGSFMSSFLLSSQLFPFQKHYTIFKQLSFHAYIHFSSNNSVPVFKSFFSLGFKWLFNLDFKLKLELTFSSWAFLYKTEERNYIKERLLDFFLDSIFLIGS